MLKVVYAKKEKIPQCHEEYDNDMFFNDDLVGFEYFNRLRLVVEDFLRRDWIFQRYDHN